MTIFKVVNLWPSGNTVYFAFGLDSEGGKSSLVLKVAD